MINATYVVSGGKVTACYDLLPEERQPSNNLNHR
jgi:hypothetical protein